MESVREVNIGKIKIGRDNPFVLFAGPCVIESEALAMRQAKLLKEVTGRLGVPLVYKASYDKANRTSVKSFRGPGLIKGLKILRRIKDELGLPVLSDVHCSKEVKAAARVLDVLQIPAFLSRQTDLLLEAASTGKVINVKKGQFLAPWDMRHVVRKIESEGNKKIILTERGVSFGYNNLVSDFRSILIMKEFGYPVVYDATHSVQMPGGLGDKSGGERRFVPHLSMAAISCGVNGLFIEAHENPDRAPSDGPNMMKMDELERMLIKAKSFDRLRMLP